MSDTIDFWAPVCFGLGRRTGEEISTNRRQSPRAMTKKNLARIPLFKGAWHYGVFFVSNVSPVAQAKSFPGVFLTLFLALAKCESAREERAIGLIL
jgi:hypothetical protein